MIVITPWDVLQRNWSVHSSPRTLIHRSVHAPLCFPYFLNSKPKKFRPFWNWITFWICDFVQTNGRTDANQHPQCTRPYAAGWFFYGFETKQESKRFKTGSKLEVTTRWFLNRKNLKKISNKSPKKYRKIPKKISVLKNRDFFGNFSILGW